MAKTAGKERLVQEENVGNLDLRVHLDPLEKKAKRELMVNRALMVYQEHQEKEVHQVSGVPQVAMEFQVKRDLLENVELQAALDQGEVPVNLEEMECLDLQE